MRNKTYYQNPQIDHLVIFPDLDIVPTKQDKYKISTNSELPSGKVYYELNSDTQSVMYLDEVIRGHFTTINFDIIPKNIPVEIVLSIGTDTQKRYNNVDVDNLAKAILDCLNGCVLEDDSQVQRLVCTKFVDSTLKWHSIALAITKLTDDRRGILKNINLFSDQPYPDNY